MSRKKISTTIYVTPEQSERLRLLHERTKVPVAVYIREGIDLVLRQYNHLLPGQLSLAGEQAASARSTSHGGVGHSDGEAMNGSPVRQERSAGAVADGTGGAESIPERVAGGKG